MDNSEQSNSFSIDVKQNAATLSIGKDIYLRILRKALEQSTQDIQDLTAALSTGDFDKIQSLSHRFKGDYDNLRIPELSSVAKKINEISKTTKDREQVELLFSDFKGTFEKLQQFIRNLN